MSSLFRTVLILLGVLLVAAPAAGREPDAPRQTERERDGAQASGHNSGSPARTENEHDTLGADSSAAARRDQPWLPPERALVYHGNVVVADLGVAHEPIMIERVCGGDAPIPEGYTDIKGRFAIQLGWWVEGIVDAADAHPTGATAVGRPPNGLWGCELRASLPGYRSESIVLGDPMLVGNGRLGTIVLHRLAGAIGSALSPTSAEASFSARRHYMKARRLADRGQLYDAAIEYEKAVQAFPRYAAAWSRLGDILRSVGDYERARSAYGQAVAADPLLLQPDEGLTLIAAERQRRARVAKLTQRVAVLGGSSGVR